MRALYNPSHGAAWLHTAALEAAPTPMPKESTVHTVQSVMSSFKPMIRFPSRGGPAVSRIEPAPAMQPITKAAAVRPLPSQQALRKLCVVPLMGSARPISSNFLRLVPAWASPVPV
jgi:hypothetical protein